MATHGPHDGDSYASERDGSVDAGGDPPDPLPEWTATDPDPDDPRAYHGDEVLPPPAYTTGRYAFTRGSGPTHPPDPILPYVAPPVARRRRSDWPVLVVALVISSIVLAACCIAGYVLYAGRGSLFS